VISTVRVRDQPLDAKCEQAKPEVPSPAAAMKVVRTRKHARSEVFGSINSSAAEQLSPTLKRVRVEIRPKLKRSQLVFIRRKTGLDCAA